MAKRKVAMGLVLLFGLAAAASAATVTYDLVPVADPAVRTMTVAPGAGVPVQLTVLLEPEGSPTNGLANVVVNLYTDLGVAQTPLTLDPGFTAVFPLFANGGLVENDDLTQIGGFQNLGGTPTTGIGIGTPLVVGTMTLKTPATPGTYEAALNAGATTTVLNSSPPPTYIEATTATGTPLTITVAASGGGGGGGGGGGVENQAPTAVADANPKEGQAPLNVSFVGTGSSDPDGDQLSYSWDFGDGTNGTGATSTHQYAEAGTYTATLTVDDARGGTDTSDAITITVTAAPLPPDDDGNDGGDGGSDGDGNQDGDGTGDIDDPEPGADGDDVISPPPAVLPCGAGIVETAMLTFAGLFLIQSGRRRY